MLQAFVQIDIMQIAVVLNVQQQGKIMMNIDILV